MREMRIKIYQVDAFTDKLFSGNPAAVCPIGSEWPDDSVMQNIASENNLSETAFILNRNNKYHIRWFTPAVEVDLCGHATLASAYVQFNYENYHSEEINYESRSGILSVKKNNDMLTMNFPSDNIVKADLSVELKSCFDIHPVEVFRGISDYLMIFKSEVEIENIKYNLENISQINSRGIIISARGSSSDFVSRFFAPQSGVNEDPVTGSAHTTLTNYWSKALNKNELTAIQLSKRKGFIFCRNLGDRVEISGKAKLYMQGEINI
jgi:PhzF family phenazine biosynthesis protein